MDPRSILAYRVAETLKSAVLANQSPAAALRQALAAEGVAARVFVKDVEPFVVGSGAPDSVLVADPHAGVRPSRSGIPAACVCAALAPISASPTYGDVTQACVMEFAAGKAYLAAKGAPPLLIWNGTPIAPPLSTNLDLDALSWAFEMVGRPMARVASALDDLAERSAREGGSLTLASGAFAITRVFLGFLDAFVDVGPGIPGLASPAAGGSGLYPYGAAAALRIARARGCVVTDCAGEPLDAIPLFSPRTPSLVVAASEGLHRRLVEHLRGRPGSLAAASDLAPAPAPPRGEKPRTLHLPFFKGSSMIMADHSLFLRRESVPALDLVGQYLRRAYLTNPFTRHLACLERPEDFPGYAIPDAEQLRRGIDALRDNGIGLVELDASLYKKSVLDRAREFLDGLFGKPQADREGRLVYLIE